MACDSGLPVGAALRLAFGLIDVTGQTELSKWRVLLTTAVSGNGSYDLDRLRPVDKLNWQSAISDSL